MCPEKQRCKERWGKCGHYHRRSYPPYQLQIGDVMVGPDVFVDNMAVANGSPKDGERFSKFLELIVLQANPTKSAIIVKGGENARVTATRNELKVNPVKVHFKPIQVTEAEPYIGFYLNEKGYKESMNKTVKTRTAKAWPQAATIQSIINYLAIQPSGCMRAGVTLCQSILPAVLTYSSKSWVACPAYII